MPYRSRLVSSCQRMQVTSCNVSLLQLLPHGPGFWHNFWPVCAAVHGPSSLLIELSECKNRHQTGFMSDLPLSIQPASQPASQPARHFLLIQRQAQCVWMHVSPCAKGRNERVCVQVRGFAHVCVWMCAPWGSEESTLISVSEESVIEHKPFCQRVEAVTRCNNTRGDKKAEVLFCPLFSLYSVSILPFLCFSPFSFIFHFLFSNWISFSLF